MDLKHTIEVPIEFVKRAKEHGKQIVSDYRAGFNARSKSVACFGAENNIELQAHAKMAEVAFAIWLGMNPEGLHWGRHTDPDYDVFWDNKRWDVKATKSRGRYLIWPIAKNEFFEKKRFDALVLVRGDEPRFEICGWIAKKLFQEMHQVAGKDHRLVFGTWYMDLADLFGVELINRRDELLAC